MKEIEAHIRNIPDFPRPGIQFKDITPLLKQIDLLDHAVSELCRPFLDSDITAVAGVEARGFIFGSLAARHLGVGFIPLRKPGKLPFDTRRISYELEYGAAGLEIHSDAVGADDRVLLIDDLIATGGTASAGCTLIEQRNAQIAGCAFLIELDELKGREKLKPYEIHALLHY